MGLFNLSSVKNHPRRSGFDLSSKVAFTAKVGELLPVKWTLTMPGDKFSLKEQHFTRTQPVNTSAYTRVREYYDWFWCPLHLLWRNAPEVIAQIQQNVQHASSFDGSILLGSVEPGVESLTLGYLPRYYAWKTSVDYVLGAFTTTEKEWVAPESRTERVEEGAVNPVSCPA